MTSTENDFQKLLNWAYFFLKFRPRTVKELRDYLLKKIKERPTAHDDVKQVLKHLHRQHFIDDKEFVRWFVEERSAYRKKSIFILKQELMRHGVEKELIDEFFENQQIDEEALAIEALRSKTRMFEHLTHDTKIKKAYSFLVRRGFGFDIAKKVIGKIDCIFEEKKIQ